MSAPSSARNLVAAVEARLDALEGLEPIARTIAFAAVQGLTELYGEGLARFVGGLEAWAADTQASDTQELGPIAMLLADELITHLLILHGLHPLDLATRVEQALDETRPYLRSHGGDAEVVSIEDDVVRIRMIGSCHGCPASMVTLSQALGEVIRRLAPEIERVEEVPSPTLVQLDRRTGLEGARV